MAMILIDGVDYGGGDSFPLNGGGGGFAPASASAPLAPMGYDFDLSQIGAATARGNTAADIRSAYEVFTTGYSSGRGYGYAQDIQRRFSPGLVSTYGSSDIRTAAANYLDSAGLPRLASFVSPTPTPTPTPEPEPVDKQFFPLPVGPEQVTQAIRQPIEILADVFRQAFGAATYQPPLQSQAYGYTPVSVPGSGGVPGVAGKGGGLNVGSFLILGALAVGAWFLYKRFKG